MIGAIVITVFWFVRPADLSFDELRASVPNSEYSHFTEIDGVQIHYQEKGNGIPLVLIHGFTSSTYSWKDVFLPLSKDFRVIAVDLKGFGFSGKPDGDYSRPAQAELVSHLLDYLKIEKAWLCGNSMGGEVSLNVALHNPARVAGLILIDSAGVKVNGGGSLAPSSISGRRTRFDRYCPDVGQTCARRLGEELRSGVPSTDYTDFISKKRLG